MNIEQYHCFASITIFIIIIFLLLQKLTLSYLFRPKLECGTSVAHLMGTNLTAACEVLSNPTIPKNNISWFYHECRDKEPLFIGNCAEFVATAFVDIFLCLGRTSIACDFVNRTINLLTLTYLHHNHDTPSHPPWAQPSMILQQYNKLTY